MSASTEASPRPTDAEYAAAVGPGWDAHYRETFHAFDAGTRGASFNRAAALVPFWLAARGLWLLQVVAVVAWIILLFGALLFFDEYRDPASDSVLPAILFACATLGIVEGWAGDRLVHRRARHRIARVRAAGMSHEAMLARLRRGAFQPLGAAALAILVVIGSLALSVELAKTGGRRHPSSPAVGMRAALRNLLTAEESYFADFGRYTSTPADSVAMADGRIVHYYRPPADITVRVLVATADGWSAIATRADTPIRCVIYVGNTPPPLPADSLARPMTEGEPACTRSGR